MGNGPEQSNRRRRRAPATPPVHRAAIALRSGLVVAGAALAVVLGATSPAAAQHEFEVTGEIDHLYPGLETTLTAQVTNPEAFPIRVTTVSVQADDANDGCPGSLLRFDGSPQTLDIGPEETGTLPLPVVMDRAAPDACQGATWVLRFQATATRTSTSTTPAGGPGATAGSGGNPGTIAGPGGGGAGAPTPTGPPAGTYVIDLPDPGPGPSSFAFTGANVVALLLAAGLLVAAGLALLGWSRRSRARRDEAPRVR